MQDQNSRDFSRILGQLEAGQQAAKEAQTERGHQLERLTIAMTDHATVARSTAQEIGSKVEVLTREVGALSGQTKQLNDRLVVMEVPFREELERRARRRKMWVRIGAWGSAIGLATWPLLGPLWTATVNWLATRWTGGAPH